MTPDDAASVPQTILHWARMTPDAPAVTEADRTLTYRALATGIVRHARALQASGAGPGSFVGIQAQDRLLGLSLIIACDVIGAIAVPLSPADLQGEPFVLSRCDILCSDTPATNAQAGLGTMPLEAEALRRIAAIPADLSLLDTHGPDDALVKVARTSGSTGQPKLMGMTRRVLRSQITRSTAERTLPNYVLDTICLYNFVPHWAYVEAAMSLRAGRTAVMSSFDVVHRDLARFPGGHISLVAGDAGRLVDAEQVAAGGPWRCLLNTKGGALPAHRREALLRRIVTGLHASYGITETFRVSVIDADGIGHICPDTQCRIISSDNRPLGLNETGVIEVRTPCLIDGYLWDEAATKAAFIDGWYRTSDFGYMPAPDRLILLGRVDDMLNLGGIKVAPDPLEDQIRALDGVQDAAVVALPNAQGITELTVALCLTPGADPDAVHRGIGPIVAPHAPYFIVRHMSSLPRTETGKPQRGEIRRLLGLA